MFATHDDGTEEEQHTSGGLAIVITTTIKEQFDSCIPEEIKGRLLLLHPMAVPALVKSHSGSLNAVP